MSTTCQSCQRELRLPWRICPFCASTLGAPSVEEASPSLSTPERDAPAPRAHHAPPPETAQPPKLEAAREPSTATEPPKRNEPSPEETETPTPPPVPKPERSHEEVEEESSEPLYISPFPGERHEERGEYYTREQLEHMLTCRAVVDGVRIKGTVTPGLCKKILKKVYSSAFEDMEAMRTAMENLTGSAYAPPEEKTPRPVWTRKRILRFFEAQGYRVSEDRADRVQVIAKELEDLKYSDVEEYCGDSRNFAAPE